MSSAPVSSLCVECGLCCQGALFAQSRLTDAEAESLQSRVDIIHNKKGPAIAQPCAFLAGGCCSIYDARPESCRAFNCKTLLAHDRGDMTFDSARDDLRRAAAALQELGAALRAHCWMSAGDSVRAAWQRFAAASDAAPDRAAFLRGNAAVMVAGLRANDICQATLGDLL